MATIGRLVVTLSADSARLETTLNKTRRSLNRWSNNAVNAAKVGTAAFAGLTAVLGGGLLVAINRNAAAIDDMTKASQKLGFPIEDFQKFAFIAEKSNISFKSFTTSMQRMVRRVSEAANGTGEAVKALNELGISAQQLATLSPDQQFIKISEAMKNVASQGDRVRLAMKIFDTEGVGLVNVMSSNINALSKEFDSFGSAITQRQADMIAQFQDAKTSLNTLLGGFMKNLTAEVAPAFTLLIEQVTKFIKNMGGMKGAANKFAKAIISGVIGAIEGFQMLITGARKFGIELIDLQAKWVAFKSAVTLDAIFDKDSVNKQFDALINKRIKLQVAINEKNQFGSGAVSKLKTLLDSVGKDTAVAASSVNEYQQSQKALAVQSNKAAASLKKVAISASSLLGDTKAKENIQVNSIVEQFKKQLDIAKRQSNSGSSFLPSSIKALNQLIEASKSNAALPETTAAMQQAVNALTQTVSAIQKQPQQSIDAVQQRNMGSLTLNMITDTGKISGKILADTGFIDGIKSLVEKQMNDTARSYAQ